MTNGADKHHGSGGKKKTGAEKPKAKDAQALKRKKIVPSGLAAEKKG
jgi:hypothetical protein